MTEDERLQVIYRKVNQIYDILAGSSIHDQEYIFDGVLRLIEHNTIIPPWKPENQ